MDRQPDKPSVGAFGIAGANGVDPRSEPFSEALLRRYRAVIGGRSQRLIAARIGIDHAILSRWERGRITVRLSTVDRIVRWVELEEQRASAFTTLSPQPRAASDRTSLD